MRVVLPTWSSKRFQVRLGLHETSSAEIVTYTRGAHDCDDRRRSLFGHAIHLGHMQSLFLDLEQQPASASHTIRKHVHTYIVRPRSLPIQFSCLGEGKCLWIVACMIKNCQQDLRFSIEVRKQPPQICTIPSYFFFSFTGRWALFDCCSMLQAKRSRTSQLLF